MRSRWRLNHPPIVPYRDNPGIPDPHMTSRRDRLRPAQRIRLAADCPFGQPVCPVRSVAARRQAP